MADVSFPPATIPLADALAALPLETPERSAWPALAERLASRRRRVRWPFAVAAAAALALVAVGQWPQPVHVTPAATATTAKAANATAAGDTRLATLMDESARLERLLDAASDDGASSASAAAMGVEFEDRLASVDAQLRQSSDPARQRELWRQRVWLLRQAASLETSRHYLAANGQRLDVALVAAY
jgi:hypothetical protein